MLLKDLPQDLRPREKLLQNGAASLLDAELLALLLRTGVVGKNVLQLADELLHTFGGVAGLLQADARQLATIKGLGNAKRAELMAVLELAKRALAQQLQQQPVLDAPDKVASFVRLQLGHLAQECFAVLFLDAQLRLAAWEVLFKGTLTQTSVYPREVVLRALHHQAHSVILVHNHPSGVVDASPADIQLTQRLQAALGLVDVQVLDHLIVGRGGAADSCEAVHERVNKGPALSSAGVEAVLSMRAQGLMRH